MPLETEGLEALRNDIARMAGIMDADGAGSATAKNILLAAAEPIHQQMKANASKVTIKEIRFGPNTDEHDFQFKLKHAQSFLEEGSKVKAYVFFKGRSILFKDQGTDLLTRFIAALEDYGKLESEPRLEGKKMFVMIAPKK